MSELGYVGSHSAPQGFDEKEFHVYAGLTYVRPLAFPAGTWAWALGTVLWHCPQDYGIFTGGRSAAVPCACSECGNGPFRFLQLSFLETVYVSPDTKGSAPPA